MKYEQPKILVIPCDDLDIITASAAFNGHSFDDGETLDEFSSRDGFN